MVGKPLWFVASEQTTAKKSIQQDYSLAELDHALPWKGLSVLIEPLCPQAGSNGGRRPVY
jgi:hypothetical protein